MLMFPKAVTEKYKIDNVVIMLNTPLNKVSVNDPYIEIWSQVGNCII